MRRCESSEKSCSLTTAAAWLKQELSSKIAPRMATSASGLVGRVCSWGMDSRSNGWNNDSLWCDDAASTCHLERSRSDSDGVVERSRRCWHQVAVHRHFGVAARTVRSQLAASQKSLPTAFAMCAPSGSFDSAPNAFVVRAFARRFAQDDSC